MDAAYTSAMTTPDQPVRAARRSSRKHPPKSATRSSESSRPTPRGAPSLRVARYGTHCSAARSQTSISLTEGDAVSTVRRALPSLRIIAHEKFGTASVKIAGVTIDVVTARRETYPRARRAAANRALDHRRRPRNAATSPSTRWPSVSTRQTRSSTPPAAFPTCSIMMCVYSSRGSFRGRRHAHLSGAALRRTPGLPSRAEHGPRSRDRASVSSRRSAARGFAANSNRCCTNQPPAPRSSSRTIGVRLSGIHPALSLGCADRGDAFDDPSFTADRAGAIRVRAAGAASATPADADRSSRGLRLHRDEAAAVTAIASMREIGRTLRRPGCQALRRRRASRPLPTGCRRRLRRHRGRRDCEATGPSLLCRVAAREARCCTAMTSPRSACPPVRRSRRGSNSSAPRGSTAGRRTKATSARSPCASPRASVTHRRPNADIELHVNGH